MNVVSLQRHSMRGANGTEGPSLGARWLGEGPNRPRSQRRLGQSVPATGTYGHKRWAQLGRGVSIFVGLVVVDVAGAVWLLVSSRTPSAVSEPHQGYFFASWTFDYDMATPSLVIIAAAVGLALLAAGGIGVAERLVNHRLQRSTDARHHPLSPSTIMARTRGSFAGILTVTVLVPAHNEEASLGATLLSLLNQTTPPDRIVVVADNCTDATVAVANFYGVETFETVGNTHKKAGALNQVLSLMLGGLGDNDCVMIVDADTVLDARFIEVAADRMKDDRAIMAIGGLFFGEGMHGLLAQFQRSEYVRYSRELERRRGKVFVLTGTATMFRPHGLRTVAASRGTLLPGERGDVYDTAALTEDNELTLALKMLGAVMHSPRECRVVTELMPTWRHLWTQRLRWQRGALENLGAYGFKSTLVRYWAQQLGIGCSVVALGSFWTLLSITALASDGWVWFPFWMAVGCTFVVDRVVSAWRGGWKARILAALLLPELAYDMFLEFVYLKGVIDIALGRRARWGHVPHGIQETLREAQIGTNPRLAA